MVAGRRTGKTTAAMKRAIMNTKNTYLITDCMPRQLDVFIQIANEMGMEYEIVRNSPPGYAEVRVNDKSVHLCSPHWFNKFAHFSMLHGNEIILDEPEMNVVLFNMLEQNSQYLENIADVVMVGSIQYNSPSEFKNFYERCRNGKGYSAKITLKSGVYQQG